MNDVSAVAQRANEVAQFQPGRRLGPIGAGVDNLGFQAGNGLCGLVVLLVHQANSRGETGKASLGLVFVAEVVGGEAYLQVAHLLRPVPDQFGDVFSSGPVRRLQCCGRPPGGHQLFVQPVVLLANCPHFGVGVPQGAGPIARGPLRLNRAFQRVLPGVPIYLPVVSGYAGPRFQLFRHRNGYCGVTIDFAGSDYLMANLQHVSSSPKVFEPQIRWALIEQ